MTPLRRFYPIFIELWIAFVLVAFFIIRILGSNVGQHLRAAVKHRFGQ